MDKASIQKAWEATRYDDLSTLKKYVKNEQSANSKIISDKNHCHSLLMAASAHGAENCAKYLIDRGANVNMKNFHGFTALHWAAFAGRTNMVPILVEAGADIESRTADGKTPLHVAAFRGQKGFIDSFLEQYHPDINSVDAEGRNALFYSVTANQQQITDFLLKKNICIDQMDSHKQKVTDLANDPQRKWFADMLAKREM